MAGLLGRLLTGGGLGDVVKASTEGIRSIRNTFGKDVDAETRAKLDHELDRIQSDITKAEANHPSMFVAGWRPFIGWTCGLALFYHFLASPILEGLLELELPNVAIAELWPIIIGMLGLGTARTIEKSRGVSGRH